MIARTSFEQEHRCRLGPPRPAWLRILVLFGVSAAVLCHAQTIAPPDAGGLKVGLYKDGQLIDTLADLAPAPAADLVSSRGIALHSPAVPGGQTLPAAPALSAETQARNAAFARTAQSAVTLRDLLEGLATTAQADTTGPRAELAMRFQDFLDSTADSRAALDRTGQRLAELKLDPVIAARHAQTVAAFEQRLAEFQDRIHDAVYGRPGAVQAALDFLDEAKFVSRPSLDKASPTVQVHVLNAPELTREEADALLEGQAGTETGTQSAPETAPSTPPTQTQPAALLPAPVLQPPRPATQAQPGVGKPTRAEAPSANRGASAGRARTSRPVSPSADPATPTTESRSAASTATATSAVPQGVVPRRGRGIELAGGPPPAPDDLLPTIDVQITQAILDKAAALGNSPLAIYEFVRNNVQFQPYLGSRKGSAFTLQQLAGNDTDQASLLLALLRAAGVPCRYVRGSVEMTPEQATSWLGVDDAHTAGSILTTAGLDGLNIVDGGGNVIAIRCTRVWVEAYVPYANYRGVPNDDTGKTWIPLDPAFKGTIITPGEDVLALMGWDADAFLADYISTFHDPSPIEKLLEDVQAWLDINRPGQTVADIERTIALDELELGLLPASLPYQARSITSRFATLEDAKRYQVRFHLYSGATTFINQTLNVLDLAGRKLTIHYVGATPADQATIDAYGGIYNTPPNLVNVKPVLKLDDVVIATSPSAIGMGRTHSSDMHFLHPTGANNVQPLVQNQITAGNSQAIAFDTFLDTYDMFLAGIEIPAGPVVEGLLHPTAADYLSRVDAGLENAAALMRIVPMSDISEAIVESAIKVTYSMGGTPLTFEWTGMIVDADRRIVGVFPVDGDDTKQVPYMKLTGYDGSIMENRVFEDLYGQRAISTIKILALANDLGINACTITSSIAAQCAGFSHPSSITSAVNAALAQGHHVTIPRAPITVGLWSGTGYIDMNPATGAAGYIISGGISGNITVSGGATVDQWSTNLVCEATEVTCQIKKPAADSPSADAVFCAEDTNPIEFEVVLHVTCEDGSIHDQPWNFQTSSSVKQIAASHGAGHYTLTVSALGAAQCTRKMSVLSVDFLDASKNPVSTLKVGKWENAFNAGPTVKDNFIDLDPDRFYVRVNDQTKKGTGKVSVKLSTDSDGTAYDDDATEIELNEQPANSGIFISTNMLMVSDDVDDDFTNPNVVADDTKNDRTHKIALGGKVKVQYPETGTVICENEASVPSSLKTVQVSVVVLNIGGSPVTPLATVANAWLIAKERYAQIGINLEYTITAADQPAGVDLSDGLDVASASAPTWTQVAQESKDLIGALGTTNTTSDIHAFYVNFINAFGATDSRGVAIARYWFTDPSAAPYYYNFMVASTAGPFTAPHELGHLLDDTPGHHSDAWNLMRSGTSAANGVTESKRLDANQESTMRGDSHAQ